MLEESTKCAGAIMHSGKEYVALMEMHGDVEDDELVSALQTFTGNIYQVPPVRSSVARKPRVRTVYWIRILEREGRMILMDVACSGGTYIRKLCHDIGEYLGLGAHMEELRRVRAGPFTEENSTPFIEVLDAWSQYREGGDENVLRRVVHPVEESLQLLPKVYILDSAVDALCHGADLMVAGVSKVETGIVRGDLTAVLTLKGEVVGLGLAVMSTEEMLNSSEGLAVDITRVVMPRSTYPPMWKGGLRHKVA
ncbi:MAG: RNA-guided pseudouridylation complex pseudouridine synthase subunit Cbf5 [Nitrososphaerota archaeon]